MVLSDTIVSPTCLLEAKEFLNINGIKNQRQKYLRDCEHKITAEGSSLRTRIFKKKFFIIKTCR